MADELGSSGKIIDTKTLIATVFNNIDPEFSKVVTVLSLRDSPLSFAQLTNALINFETRLNQIHKCHSSTPVPIRRNSGSSCERTHRQLHRLSRGLQRSWIQAA